MTVRRAVAVAALLVTAACGGGGGDDDGDAASAARDDAETSSTTSTAAGGATTTAVAAGGTAATSTTTGAPAAAGATEATTGRGASAPAGAPDAIAAGTYRYRQSGEIRAGASSFAIPPEGTLVAAAPTAERTQKLERYIDPDGEPFESWLRYEPRGISVFEVALRFGAQEFRCRFDPAITLLQWPPRVGGSSTGHAECGGIVIDMDIRVTGRTPVTLDGATYDAFVIETTTRTSGELQSTSEQVDHFVAELRLTTHSSSEGEGTYRGATFTTTTTSDLLSGRPE